MSYNISSRRLADNGLFDHDRSVHGELYLSRLDLVRGACFESARCLVGPAAIGSIFSQSSV